MTSKPRLVQLAVGGPDENSDIVVLGLSDDGSAWMMSLNDSTYKGPVVRTGWQQLPPLPPVQP